MMNPQIKSSVFREGICYAFLFVVSVLFITICSTTTSPLMPPLGDGDSAIFQIIGKGWAEGALPYVDLWDCKGPLIFFINAAGYFLFGSRIGIWVIECLCLTVTAIFWFKMFHLKFERLPSLLWTFLSICFLGVAFNSNAVEEYCLPFLTISFFFILKWSHHQQETGQTTHPPFFAFVYGLSFAASFLTRLTNAIGICAVVFVITIFLIYSKEWKNLGWNALAFLGGVILLTGPFLIYFAVHGALDEMWYGTISYLMEYAGNSGIGITSSSITYYTLVLRLGICLILIVIGILQLIAKRSKVTGILWIVLGSVTLVYLMSINNWAHYAIIAVPYFVIGVIEWKDISFFHPNWKKRLLNCGFVILCVLSLAGGSIGLGRAYHNAGILINQNTSNQSTLAFEANLCTVIPNEEKDSFVAYNCPSELYLYMGVTPAYRFFTVQDWEMEQGPSLRKKMCDTFQNGNAKWILIPSNADAEIMQIIEDRYIMQCEKAMDSNKPALRLFRLDESK